MLKTFDDITKLYDEVIRDREFVGEGSATADRFPVRFVLFDNFQDCSDFVDELMRSVDMGIKHINDWLDSDYPDTMISHKRLADNIKSLILDHSKKYWVVMPFSELSRFYNNQPEKAEFNTLISTIKGFDSAGGGYMIKQRIYIPIVGLEGKMEYFKDDSQSFIWYYHKVDSPNDYRLILTDSTTYGVQNLESKFTIADSVKNWLGCWKYPEMKENIICTSHSIFAHADYAQPDNAFSYVVCHNAYEFLTKGLHLDVDCIDYREEDSIYWGMLAGQVDIDHFKFEQFFNEKFGIHQLANYKVFFKQWFEHKETFMRWLLAKYYTYKFCNDEYICRVLQQMDSYSDIALAQQMARSIFNLENPIEYLEQREIGLRIAEEHGVVLPDEDQKRVIDKVKHIANSAGILTAIKYLGTHTFEERCLIVEWYKEGKLNKEQLRELYPDLYYYLGKTIVSAEEEWVLDYIDAYKEAKVTNTYTDKVKQIILEKNENELAHYKWSNKFSHTRTLLNSRTDIQHYFWIDGLGLDWMPFILQIVKEMESEGFYVNETYVATAMLPTRTQNNKEEIEKLSAGMEIDKIGDLDKVAHTNGREYPQYIVEDLDMMRKELVKMLKAHANEKIAIVSDHGMTYLSQLCDGYNLKGFKSDHWGRVVVCNRKSKVVKDNKYLILQDGLTLCSLRHESLASKVPNGMGAHGGATPEEELVPIIIISPEKEKASWYATQKSFEIEEASPIFEVEIFGLKGYEKPMVEYDGKYYQMTKNGNLYSSERIALSTEVKKITLHVGPQNKEFTIDIKMAVQEDDLFGDIL